MSELSGLELRKATAEALGWRFENYHNGGGFWHKDGCKKRQRNSVCSCRGQHYIPAFESAPAEFWPAFETWCDENHFGFDIIRAVTAPAYGFAIMEMRAAFLAADTAKVYWRLAVGHGWPR